MNFRISSYKDKKQDIQGTNRRKRERESEREKTSKQTNKEREREQPCKERERESEKARGREHGVLTKRTTAIRHKRCSCKDQALRCP